jgi:hypothetical protein
MANFVHYKAVVASFGPPRVCYFRGSHHIWRAFPYPPPGEAPDGRPATPHGVHLVRRPVYGLLYQPG